MMVGFDPSLFADETKFVRGLISEESVYCLPGSAFSLTNWFRLVLLAFPNETTTEACERIAAYCARHLRSCVERLEATMSIKKSYGKIDGNLSSTCGNFAFVGDSFHSVFIQRRALRNLMRICRNLLTRKVIKLNSNALQAMSIIQHYRDLLLVMRSIFKVSFSCLKL